MTELFFRLYLVGNVTAADLTCAEIMWILKTDLPILHKRIIILYCLKMAMNFFYCRMCRNINTDAYWDLLYEREERPECNSQFIPSSNEMWYQVSWSLSKISQSHFYTKLFSIVFILVLFWPLDLSSDLWKFCRRYGISRNIQARNKKHYEATKFSVWMLKEPPPSLQLELQSDTKTFCWKPLDQSDRYWIWFFICQNLRL